MVYINGKNKAVPYALRSSKLQYTLIIFKHLNTIVILLLCVSRLKLAL